MSRIDSLITEAISLDALEGKAAWLSRVDPRAILLATVGFILVVVSFDRYAIAGLLPLALFPVVLARLGEVPLRGVARKVLGAMPFVLLIGLFNPLFDPTPRIELLGQPIAGGWLSFASILVRAVLTVSAAASLVACLGVHALCSGLARLGVAPVLTTQLLFMHRYILVLAEEFRRMNTARELRGGATGAMPLAVYGSLLGHLLLRTLDRAQRIHQAMLSRGFAGHLPMPGARRWRWADTAFLAVSLFGCLLVRTTNLPTLLGRLLLGLAT